MPQSYTILLVHIVFATRDRKPLITGDIQPRLYEYLGGHIRGEKCVLYEIGGIEDHIHMLVRLHQDIRLQDFLRDLKSHSSGWVHRTFDDKRSFAWQGGYGAFSVSASKKEDVVQYIQNQVEHHKTIDFRDEFIALLRKHEVEFDERYLFE